MRSLPLAPLSEYELRRLAKQAGCRVLEVRARNAFGEVFTELQLDCGDNEHAIHYLNLVARHDAWHPLVREFALSLRRALVEQLHREPLPSELATMVQRYVQTNISFVREKDEFFQHALYTLRAKAGDCDDHARLVAALLFAMGMTARVVGVPNSTGAVAHVAPQVSEHGWKWVETTIAANYNEPPRAAAHRLGLDHARHDVAG